MLSTSPNLNYLQLRASTNDTPFPYFHPVLRLDELVNLRSLTLIHINKKAVLGSIGDAMFSNKHLDRLSLWADENSQLPFLPVFDNWVTKTTMHLKALDLRGFVDLRLPSKSMWDHFSLADLKELTLDATSPLLEDPGDIWDMLTAANMSLTSLKTSLVSTSLVTFISSFVGLKTLCLMPRLWPQSARVITPCIAVVTNLHSLSLKVLSVQIRNENGDIYLLDQKCLKLISMRCTSLEELGFGISTHELVSHL